MFRFGLALALASMASVTGRADCLDLEKWAHERAEKVAKKQAVSSSALTDVRFLNVRGGISKAWTLRYAPKVLALNYGDLMVAMLKMKQKGCEKIEGVGDVDLKIDTFSDTHLELLLDRDSLRRHLMKTLANIGKAAEKPKEEKKAPADEGILAAFARIWGEGSLNAFMQGVAPALFQTKIDDFVKHFEKDFRFRVERETPEMLKFQLRYHYGDETLGTHVVETTSILRASEKPVAAEQVSRRYLDFVQNYLAWQNEALEAKEK